MDDDINNTYFIKKVLEDGTTSDTALANRLADKRYAAFSDAFGFANLAGPNTERPDFADTTVALYEKKQFEIAIGDQNEDMRLALNAEGEIKQIAQADRSNDSKWFSIMGSPPLRTVFETALGLPSSFSQLDLDRQLEVFKDKSQQRFGTSDISDFANNETQNDLIRQFLVRSEINASINATSPASIALTLLQGF
ncbi:DUF1217 domain-containing protein [Parasulfitobacter algicola]|uniref:DUF1217 domain-containing protein n=1 Tax=Parasulfitobacter algicola TaxID=2614809 RepID=UPI0031B5E622